MTVKTQDRQTVFDIALQYCGNVEAAFVVAALNDVSVTNAAAGASLIVPGLSNKKVVAYYDTNSILCATEFTNTNQNFNNMSLQSKTIDYDLSLGDTTSEPISLDGNVALALATFDGVVGTGLEVTLQESPDGDNYADVPNSAATISAGQTAQMWNIFGIPAGALLRLKVSTNQNAGHLRIYKLLSHE